MFEPIGFHSSFKFGTSSKSRSNFAFNLADTFNEKFNAKLKVIELDTLLAELKTKAEIEEAERSEKTAAKKVAYANSISEAIKIMPKMLS
jgi:hypothetical protein